MLAKLFLSIAILLVTVLIVLAANQAKNSANVAQIASSLQARSPSEEQFTPAMVADLPEPVQRYFLHAIAPGTSLAKSVQLKMSGSIRLAPDQEWMPLQAEEILSTNGFVWQATAGEGAMQLRGADYYFNGDGRMRFSLWGLIPVVTAHSPDVMRSAIGRLAGEFFWLPSALLPQRGVTWNALDENTIQANLEVENQPIELTFVIDAQGRLLRGTLPRWGDRTEDGHYAEIPFGGEHQAERTFGGYTIPSQTGAGWWMVSDRFAQPPSADRYFEFIRMTIEQATFS